jgi:nicotinate-nucleotide adenylyltransferase
MRDLNGPERVGIMGGTFDPVHYGHLLIAEIARAEFDLHRVVWVPAGDPPHKTADPVTSAEHRYAMTLLATATHPQFEVSRLELERAGRSYTLDTVLTFREQLPNAELFFITGADAILEILTWYRHEELIRACAFIAATRPGYDLGQLRAVLPPEYLPRIHPITTPGVDISSTNVRERVLAGKPIRFLVPEPVEAYIAKHRLYTPPA